MLQKISRSLLFLFLFLLTSVYLFSVLRTQTVVRILHSAREEEAAFRSMQLSENTIRQIVRIREESFLTVSEILTLFYPEAGGNFQSLPQKMTAEKLIKRKKLLQNQAGRSYERLCSAYSAVWDDLECFPVDAEGIQYENSWMFERSYGGKRGHEGTDLMPPENLAGYYPVVSMTDGIVEKIGWLEQGGYRIGIRSPSGGYFYYAHLDSYAQEFQEGDTVYAGTLLGRMGDTGYGAEGTKGQFDVHLHLGIYIRTECSEELSVNPYWVLRYLQIE